MKKNCKDILLKAIKSASEKAGPILEDILDLHLKRTLGTGIEIVCDNPKEFKESLTRLFGEYSTRLFELILIQEIKKIADIGEGLDTIEEIVDQIRRYESN